MILQLSLGQTQEIVVPRPHRGDINMSRSRTINGILI